MQEDEKSFSPEEIDEQVELPIGQLSPEDAHLILDLRKSYRAYAARNARSLERAWERIAQAQHQDLARKSESTTPEEPWRASAERNRQMNSANMHLDRSRRNGSKIGRTLSILAAALLMVVLVSSLLVVLHMVRTQATNRSSAHQPSTTNAGGTHPVQSPTPGIYMVTDKDWYTQQVSRADVRTHAVLWTTVLGESVSPVVVVGDTLYMTVEPVYPGDNYVYALGATTGRILWHTDLGKDLRTINRGSPYDLGSLTTPTVLDGRVYVLQSDGNLYALNADKGNVLWHHNIGTTVVVDDTIYDAGAVAVVDGIVYGTMHNVLFAVNANTGAVVWSKSIAQSQIFTGVEVMNDVIYTSSFEESQHHSGQTQNSAVYAFHVNNGTQIWQYPLNNWVLDAPTVVAGLVYFGSFDHFVYALKASDGSLAWRYDTTSQVFGSPLIANGILYTVESGDASEVPGIPGTVKPTIIALNAATGSRLWNKQMDVSLMQVANGVLYVSTMPRLLYALDAQTGKELWHNVYGADLVDKTGVHGAPGPVITVVA